jgi:rhodanese-related sulfurtransferase
MGVSPATLPPQGRALLDVRERAAYARGHLPGAVSLPRRLIESRLPRLVTALSTPITLYGGESELARRAMVTLAAMGYVDVVEVPGPEARQHGGFIQGLNVVAKAFGEMVAHERHTPSLTADQLAELLESGHALALFDVRPRDEYLMGHIPGASNVTTGELVARVAELTDPVVVHCGGRTRAIIATESLREAGLADNVRALENGAMGWLLSGRRLENRSTSKPKAEAKRPGGLVEVSDRNAFDDGEDGCSDHWREVAEHGRDGAECCGPSEARKARQYPGAKRRIWTRGPNPLCWRRTRCVRSRVLSSAHGG